jgi:hypothetical protein
MNVANRDRRVPALIVIIQSEIRETRSISNDGSTIRYDLLWLLWLLLLLWLWRGG